VNPNGNVPVSTICDFLRANGYNLQRLPHFEWFQRVKKEKTALGPLVDNYKFSLPSALDTNCDHMIYILVIFTIPAYFILTVAKNANITCPNVSQQLIKVYLDYLKSL
jgi:hypothetical protein